MIGKLPAGDNQPEDSASGAISRMSDAQIERSASIYKWLYVAAMVAAFLTSVYTFRMLYLTFFGQQRVPEEAGHHAHESPRVMIWPLVILAVFAAVVGFLFDQSYLWGTHPFAELLAKTPSLTGAVAATESLGEFHVSIAAISMLVALAGVFVSSYFYLGDPSRVRQLQSILDLESLTRVSDAELIARWQRQSWIQAIDRGARRVGLQWLTRLTGEIVLLLLLVVSAPLLLGRFVSPYRLSYGKFFVDEVYDLLFVRPLRSLATLCAVMDDWFVDGLVNAVGRIPLGLGSLLRSMQTGLLQFYALAMVLGGLVLLVALDQQLGGQVMEFVRSVWRAE